MAQLKVVVFDEGSPFRWSMQKNAAALLHFKHEKMLQFQNRRVCAFPVETGRNDSSFMQAAVPNSIKLYRVRA
jgi:hypothetical protein